MSENCIDDESKSIGSIISILRGQWKQVVGTVPKTDNMVGTTVRQVKKSRGRATQVG